MLKYIVSAIVVIAVWATWFFLLPDSGAYFWVPALFTLLVGIVLIAIVVARRLRARNAARELEKALAAQAAEQARSARPDMQAEILQMQQEFQKAIGTLKSSKLGENALYALPWHLIVGPPGSGKSTALRNSGLQFPYMSTSGGGIRGVGGTRNCDWWLTNEAVLLDTAGRWTTEEEDRDEWMSFLDLIKKFRPRKPLNGIIAAVSLDQLGGAHEEEVNALARRMRERIDEVQNRLAMSVPVYVLFTKADLIPGFIETFSDLSKQERGQVWGFTVPLASPPPDAGMHFQERFDELAAIVGKRSLKRMGDERKIEARELIHGFPQQLASLRKNCADFVAQVFEGSVLGETPMFRGVYFSSGTQEGRPIDRVMHKMAEAFGIHSEVNLGEPVTEAKSYFLRDVFLNVVFPDRDIAARSEGEQQRQRRNQFVAAGAIFATALLISVLPALAWANNRGYLDETRDIVDRVTAATAEQDVIAPEDLAPLRERVAELQHHDARGAPLLMRMGMYQDDVRQPTSKLYTTLLRSHVVGPIVEDDRAAMEDFGRRYETLRDSMPSGREHSENYDRLRAHLLVSRPTEPSEPALGENDDVEEWVSERITERWLERMGGEGEVTEESVAEMRSHANLYTSLLAKEVEGEVDAASSMRFPRDDETVRRVRGALTRVPLSDMALDRLIQDVPRRHDQRLAQLVGTVEPMSALSTAVCSVDADCDSGRCTNRRCEAFVRGAFTRQAWDNEVRDVLYGAGDARLFGEPWVLGVENLEGQPSEEQRQEELRVLRNQYFRQYVVEWREFLSSIDVRPPQGNAATLAGLRALTRGTPQPHRLLFQQVLYNTALPMPEGEEPSATGEAASNSIWDSLWKRLERVRGGRAASQILRTALGSSGEEPEAAEVLTPEHVYLAFEGFTQFGAVPPPPEPQEGQPPPPAPVLPIGSYEEQLASVRDALQAHLDTPRGTAEALETALGAARTTTRSLIESQEVGWRPRLLALLWPPIEGSTNSHALEQATGAGRSWCTEVFTPYKRNVAESYPLNPSGHDVPLADFGAFYAPEGTLWAFYKEVLERRIQREGDSFTFATNLGQQAGNAYRSSLLQYLERASDISATFFPPGAAEPKVEYDVRIRPSVRVATQEFCAGGKCYEYHNGPEQWQRYSWPGEDPVAGASIEIRGADGIHERLEQEGEWGLFRLLEQGTVTSTSRGRRVFTMTWRLRNHQVDVAIDIRPVRGDAPFFGVAGRERNPPFLQPLRARHVNPPEQIVNGRTTCRVQ